MGLGPYEIFRRGATDDLTQTHFTGEGFQEWMKGIIDRERELVVAGLVDREESLFWNQRAMIRRGLRRWEESHGENFDVLEECYQAMLEVKGDDPEASLVETIKQAEQLLIDEGRLNPQDSLYFRPVENEGE